MRVFDSLRQVGKHRLHLIAGFKIEFTVRKSIPEPASSSDWNRNGRIIIDTEKSIVSFCIILFHVIDVIGGNHFYIVLSGKPEQHFINPLLFFKTMPVQFYVKIIT